MKVSKSWLSDYLDLSAYSDEELFNEINAHINEIESYSKMVEATNLTVGKVLDCIPHPDSDHLHVCQVEVKPGVVMQIVCGAPNVGKDELVIVANVGAVLPGNFKIKASKIRGVESNGMLCSLQELGVEEKYVPAAYKDGIYNFAPGTVNVGDDPLKALGLDDTVIDLELTSNRSDLLSIEGVAFDLGAVLSQKVNVKKGTFKEEATKNPISVTVDTDKCYKYNLRYLADVTVKESPMWMKSRLVASGIRPINNVVDITNYVLMEMGQPLHSFDADKLGNKVVVRQAKKGEKLVTLDEQERALEETDVVISNGDTPLCVAGVMGGLSTEVDDNTVLKTDGPEQGVPHFFVDRDDITKLFGDFELVKVRHIDDCYDGDKWKNQKHYFIEAVVRKQAKILDYSDIYGKHVDCKIDRPMGTAHPRHAELVYPVNYGYVPGIIAGDGAEQDVYILGVDEALKEFSGTVIAVYHRFNDNEDKWIVAPDGMDLTREEILSKIDFQERFFDGELYLK